MLYFVFILLSSTLSFSQSFVDKLRLYERSTYPLTITDTNQIEWDWDCSLPNDIQKSLLSISCVPDVWHYSSEYSYYCCFNLNVVFVNPKVIMAIFYTNANTDFTRSLIILSATWYLILNSLLDKDLVF